ncbi:MAG: molecular chaperone TorD family protein [Gammaproteobacteria bacterium]|nr:molecular chaperone TorD family protein [Gammaproteobacteria bacterium]
MNLHDANEAIDFEAEQARYDALRAANYAILGSLLARPPSGELLAELAAAEPEGADDGALDAAWRGLADAAAGADAQEVADEYQELFIGVGRGELVPYGSWYQTGFLMERPLGELRADLARLGIARQEGVCEPEDHIGALCEVMSLLIADPELGVDYATQRAFHATHLGPYLARFWSDLGGADSACFYRAVSQLGAAFTDLETKYFSLPE